MSKKSHAIRTTRLENARFPPKTGHYQPALLIMNKLMAMLFAFGAISSFGLSQRDSFPSQDVGRYGNPIGEVRIVPISQTAKLSYEIFGAVNMVACIYFISRIRGDNLRR
jgi:hypothetical protein